MTFKKLDNGTVEIESEIGADELKKEFAFVLNKMVNEAELPGFRKGKAPQKMIQDKVGDLKILEEATFNLIEKAYPSLVETNKIRPVSSPKVEILKLEIDQPVRFKVTVSVLPEFELPDYKEIAARENKKEVKGEDLKATEKEIEDVVLQIRTANQSKEDREAKKEPPELTDSDVEKLGKFSSVIDLRAKIKENIAKEKENKLRDKKRAATIDNLVSSTKINVPDVLIQSELSRMFSQFSADVERMGLKPELYLKQIKKTEEDLFKEWRLDAEKSAKLQLIIDKIADIEKIQPEESKIEREIEHLMLHYKNADKDKVRSYVETVLTNDMVFLFLESVK
jgi:FKBP-type peptidyl-prolyl cis-trans isomerase (trigger factor)